MPSKPKVKKPVNFDVPADVISSSGGKASYPAVPIRQNNHRFYFTTIPVIDLFPYCFVSRRDENPTAGFQRTLSSARAADIARYLDNSEGSIPTNIVLSAQGEADLLFTPKTKTIRYRRAERAFLVLDGQHRLFGYSRTRKPHRVPVAIYEGLTPQEEVALFIDINTNQRGVPAALLLDIKQLAERETIDEIQMRRWFDRLNTDSESPLNGFLSASASAKGRISRVTFNRGVKQIAKNAIIEKLPDEKQYILFRNYLTAIEAALRDASYLRRSAFFEAFCEIFDDVLRLAHSNHRDYKLVTLQEVLGAVRNVDLTSIPTQGKDTLTKAAIVPVLKGVLAGQVDVTEDMV